MQDTNSPQLVKRLIDIGFTEREAKVYMSLLNRRAGTAYEIQKYSGVPLSKVYATVDKLAAKGYIKEQKQGKKRILEPIRPKQSFDSYIAQLNDQIDVIDKISHELDSIYTNSGKVLQPFEYIEIVHGDDNIHRKFVELVNTSKQEILSFTKPPFASKSKEMLQAQIDAYLAFVERGGISRTIYEVNEDSPARMFFHITEGLKIDEDFRIAESLDMKLFIFDRKTLLITEEDQLSGNHELTQSVINQRTTVNAYITLFNFYWDNAVEPKEWIRQHEDLVEEKLHSYKGK